MCQLVGSVEMFGNESVDFTPKILAGEFECVFKKCCEKYKKKGKHCKKCPKK